MTGYQRVKHIKPGAEGSSPINIFDKTVVGGVEADCQYKKDAKRVYKGLALEELSQRSSDYFKVKA